MKRTVTTLAVAALLAGGLTACTSDADVASENLSKDADNFKIFRRVVFYNGITGKYILEVDGFCSIGNNDTPGKMSVTCRMEDGRYVKHFLGTSDNVTWFAEQMHTADVSTQRYKVIFKPSTIIPDVEVR